MNNLENINEYEDCRVPYPLEKEHELFRVVSHGDKEEADKYLNELLVHIFYYALDEAEIKFRVSELLVIMIRAAASGGMEVSYALRLSREYTEKLQSMRDFDEITEWLSENLKNIMDRVFSLRSERHSDSIFKAIGYMNRNYSKKLTLEEVAASSGYSATYFSRIFKEDTGISFSEYLGVIRVEKGKKLLSSTNMTIAEIGAAVGFSDQSHFSRTFKKVTEITPDHYRKNAFAGGSGSIY